MAGSNGRAKGGTAQAERHALRAKEKADARREQASGAAGWVADRAGDWSLEAQDLDWMEAQKYLWNPLMDYWFRMEIEGFEKLPEPPALLIGVHSGAPFVWDAWTVGFQWWRHFGPDRPLHGTAHDALMAAPLLSAYFRKMGVLPAAPDSIAGALAAGGGVALGPGGAGGSLRPGGGPGQAGRGGRSADRPDIHRRRARLDGGDGLGPAARPRTPARPAGAPEDVPDRAAGTVGPEPGHPPRGAAADEDPHRIPGPRALR